jgi:hypothetical protein
MVVIEIDRHQTANDFAGQRGLTAACNSHYQDQRRSLSARSRAAALVCWRGGSR